MNNIDDKLNKLISNYNEFVKGIDNTATQNLDRAYGGIIRSGKGHLVESLAQSLVEIAWGDVLKQEISRIKINKNKKPISINKNYISRIKTPEVKNYVMENKEKFVYKFGTDVQVFIDGQLVMPIECKAYTENAMLKRILFDAFLMKKITGTQKYYLFQLESQLGGDYSELNDVTYGSPSTHVLLSYVDVDLEIITLLKGERKVDKPIHKAEFFKELKISELKKAINIFANDLNKYMR